MPTASPAAARPLARGDLVLVYFPFTDLSATKRRPAVVLWADPAQIDFTLGFISSQNVTALSVGEMALLPTHPEFAQSGLSAPSKIRATKLVTLDRTLIDRWLGRLGALWTADLDRTLITALSINTAPIREEGRQEMARRLRSLFAGGGTQSLIADLGLAEP